MVKRETIVSKWKRVEIRYDKSPSFCREPAHLQHFKTEYVFLKLLNSVNNEPLKWKTVCLPGFWGAYVFHNKLWLITATHNNLSSHALPPRICLYLTIICGIVTSILLFSCTIFGFPYVVDLSHHVPHVDDLSHQQDCYFIEGTSSALGHCVM